MMRDFIHSLVISSNLAVKDLWHDKKITVCLILSLASVVAPLLLLLGLKSGIIETMKNEFMKDPLKREIKILGHQKHDLAWFEKLGAHAELGFLIPKTRILNAQVDLIKDNKNFLRKVEILPTKFGDPVLSGHTEFPTAKNQIIISYTVAHKLNVQQGDSLTFVISRGYQDLIQAGRYQVTVIGLLPESAFLDSAVFVDFDLMIAVDDFKDEFAVPEFGLAEGKPRMERKTFASARVFAKSLSGVAVLADFIRQGGTEVKTHADDIEMIRQTEKILSFIVKVIAWVAILGGAISMAGFLIVNVDRKRQHIATLRLLGVSTPGIAVYPVIQSTVIATAGFLIACSGYYFGSVEFDRVLGSAVQNQNYICRLSHKQIAGAYLLTDFVVLFAALIGGVRAIQIEPAEIFRQH